MFKKSATKNDISNYYIKHWDKYYKFEQSIVFNCHNKNPSAIV
jgi:hypothetical protein